MLIRLHKEGYTLIAGTFFGLLGLNWLIHSNIPWLFWPFLVLSLVLLGLVVQFFRNPKRPISLTDDHLVYAPADGKICVVEEVLEGEYFKDKRLQVSIFMSPLNVHVNRNPVGGRVSYFRYHPGKYLVAWHPKSSTDNERTTVVIDTGSTEVLFRQIAGAVARRIRWYVDAGDEVQQGADMGFIKFGSRVDVFLPIGTEILVNLNDQVKGNQTILAKLAK